MARTLHHHVPAEHTQTVWDNAVAPVLEVDPGETVTLQCRDASGGQLTPESTAADVLAMRMDEVNPVTGPVHVRGARPGDTLTVEILSLAPSPHGWTAIIPGFGLLADDFPEPWLGHSVIDAETASVRFLPGITLPLAPFPGTIGVAPAAPGPHPILPPSTFGGNLDIRHLTPGATLHLPVGVEGARFSVGDTHAAMGDGEVCGTAVESAMAITVRLGLLRDHVIAAPQFVLPAGHPQPLAGGPQHVCTGVGPDLMGAARDATRATIEHIMARYDLTAEEAYAVASVAGDLRIHELVDAPHWVVGMWLPEAIFG